MVGNPEAMRVAERFTTRLSRSMLTRSAIAEHRRAEISH
jgi:hypothetical protein